MSKRICLITECDNEVQPMNEVDIGVGIMQSNEVCICEYCYPSNDESIKSQIKALNEDFKDYFGGLF